MRILVIQLLVKLEIDAFLKGTQLYDANEKTTGGYISGEIKLAITIRLLARGDALDLAVILYLPHTSSSHHA